MDTELNIYLQRFDTITLQETWSDTPPALSGYNLNFLPPTQSSLFGHKKGGLATYSSLKTIVAVVPFAYKLTPPNAMQALRLTPREQNKKEDIVPINLYLHPREKTKGAQQLKEELIKLLKTKKTNSLIISGDFNLNMLRNSASGTSEEEDPFVWKPSHQDNSSGGSSSNTARRLLATLEELGFRALNGRFSGDRPQVATFHSTTSSSTIDFTFLSRSLYQRVRDFHIGSMDHSDHLPQEIMIEAPTILCPPIANTLGSEYSTNERRIKCKNNDSQSLLAQAKRVLGEVQIATADLIKSWELFTKTIRDNS